MKQTIQVAMILLVTAVALTALGGCSINVVVAPNSTFANDSLNNEELSTQNFHARTVEVLP